MVYVYNNNLHIRLTSLRHWLWRLLRVTVKLTKVTREQMSGGNSTCRLYQITRKTSVIMKIYSMLVATMTGILKQVGRIWTVKVGTIIEIICMIDLEYFDQISTLLERKFMFSMSFEIWNNYCDGYKKKLLSTSISGKMLSPLCSFTRSV